MSQKRIIFVPENCRICRTCQFMCSFHHFHEFNPSKAFIRIYEDEEGNPHAEILDGCDSCLKCVESCPYGALRYE
ncbi:MAG: hypothetical protein DRJ40_00830 [Thermoprotei archaeon]|nr:MAG: hypothetical protein DRJ40_00830 [Thermoprotei archaeon]